ncbi:MAG: UbiX family flavin prenyltransferase [Pirellulaceae bacterium]|nr:UbiX family flavin prenyltransferase [Pirellulaceae bacterium]
MSHPFVLAMTGASGAVYATRLLEVLISTGYDVHLTISPAGKAVLKQELDILVDLDNFFESSLMLDLVKSGSDSSLDLTRSLAGVDSDESAVLPMGTREPGRIQYHHFQDMMAPIASGSFLTGGMIICPCSGSTLSSVARGGGANLIHRAADVHLKERRKLILVPRESPLSRVHLENMRLALEAGAVMLPAMPGWYHGVRTLRDLVDFVVARILDQLEIEHTLMRRWGEQDVGPEGGAASL